MMKVLIIFFLKSCLFYRNLGVEALEGNGIFIADPDEFPYVVSFVRKSDRPTKVEDHICGGSLITRNIILTAAHCFKDESRKKLQVVVGSIDLTNGKNFEIEWFVTYKTWAKENNIHNPSDPGDHDIAAVKLAECVDESITPVKITTKHLIDFYGETVKTVGWGTTNTNLPPGYLLTASLRVMSRIDCLTSTRRYGMKDILITQSHLCTRAVPPILLGCGDSGGPLVFNNELIAVNEAVCASSLLTINCPRHEMLNTHVGLEFYKDFIESVQNREPTMNCCTIC